MNDDDMQEDDIGTGTHVEDSRDYSPVDSGESLVDKVKDVLGGDDETEDEDDDEDLDEEPMIGSETDEEERS